MYRVTNPRYRPRSASSQAYHVWPARLIGLVVFVGGCQVLLHSLLARFPTEIRLAGSILPFGTLQWHRPATLLLGFLLVYLSAHLYRRRRAAWYVATAAMTLLLALHVHHWRLALAPALLLGLLVMFRSDFTVRSEPKSIVRGLLLAAGILAVAVVVGAVGFELLDRRDFGADFGLAESLVRTLRQFSLVGNQDLTPLTRHASWFLEGLSVMGIFAEILAALSFFRPVAFRVTTLPRERQRAATILGEFGRSSYDHFKIGSDKSFFFSASGRSFIAYRTVSNVALALGDPVGPEEESEGTISGFVALCRENGWTAAFLMPEVTLAYQRLGLSVVKIGEEAVIDLDRFLAQTVNKKYFRYVRRRLEGEGYVVTRLLPPHSAELLREIREVSDEWLSLPRRREFGFCQGSFDQDTLATTPLFALRGSAGRMVAFASQVPSYRPGEANFDLMRRRPDSHWAAMDYLFQEMLGTLREEGYATFNMGMAPFAGLAEGSPSSWTEKGIRELAERVSWLSSLKGLHQYKSKFEPRWEERYLVYDGGPISLPRIGLAVARAM